MIRICLTAALAAAALAGTAADAGTPDRTVASWHPESGKYCVRWSRRDANSVMGTRLYGRECRRPEAWRLLGVRFTHRDPGQTATGEL